MKSSESNEAPGFGVFTAGVIVLHVKRYSWTRALSTEDKGKTLTGPKWKLILVQKQHRMHRFPLSLFSSNAEYYSKWPTTQCLTEARCVKFVTQDDLFALLESLQLKLLADAKGQRKKATSHSQSHWKRRTR